MPTGVAWHRAAACLLALTLAASGHRAGFATELPSIAGLLDRYRSGAFDAAVSELSAEGDSEAFRTAFIRGADAWIASEPADAPARRLAATALAVEVAHARLAVDALSHIVLLDWARKEWRKSPPSGAEHTWTLAAVALVERGAHEGHLFPPPSVKERGWGGTFINNALRRFPDELRFQLSRAQWQLSSRVEGDLKKLVRQPAISADAFVALAFVQLFDRDYQSAMGFARQAADLAVEPGTQYMAHFMIAFCHEAQGRLQDAVREYAAALRAVPHAQSASLALAMLLMRDNQAEAAFDLIDRSLAERPEGDDPWRLFYYGSYVRWPLLVADLRKTIR